MSTARVLPAARGAGALLPALAVAAARRAAGEGAVADPGRGQAGAGRDRLRRPLPAVGLEDDRDADADRRAARARLDRLSGVEAHRQGAGGQLSGRTAPARRSPPGGVRGATVGAEPGVAARLHRVRDPDGRHLADRRHRRLLVEATSSAGTSRPTQNHRDAIETVEIALAETERLLGRPLLERVTDPDTGEIQPSRVVTDNGPCFKSGRFAAFIDKHPELIHIRTRRKSPGQNGVRERAFGSLKYEHLYRHEIDDGHDLGLDVETYRQLFNTIRPHQSLERPPTARRPPRGPSDPSDPQPKRARNPATFVKQDIGNSLRSIPVGVRDFVLCVAVFLDRVGVSGVDVVGGAGGVVVGRGVAGGGAGAAGGSGGAGSGACGSGAGAADR